VSDSFSDVGLVAVEFHSGGRVAEISRWAIELGCEVCVADNASTYCGPGRVIEPSENLGFGAACNRAVGALPPAVHIVVLHNPDVHITRDALEALASVVRDGELDVVVPTIVGAARRPVGFRYPSAWREPALSLVDILQLRGQSRGRRAPADRGEIDRTGLVHASGRFGTAALLVLRRSAFEAVGGFDERFFLYGEDLDLWHRLEVAGFDVGFATHLEAAHAEGQGSTASAASRTVLRWLSRELFAELHGGGWRWYRLVHRLMAPFVPDDGTVRAMRSAFARGAAPADAIASVRWGKTPVGS
jgi:N-acetylglucosaminyl-diphospho-decaprenol L-rhamnosyltransferase